MKRVLSIACLLFSVALVVSLSAQGTAPTAGMNAFTIGNATWTADY